MAEPARWMVNAANRTFQQHLRDLRAFDREINALLRDAAREADRIIRLGLPPDAGIGAQIRLAQLQIVRGALDSNNAAMFDELGNILGTAVRKTAQTAAEGMFTIDSILGKSLKSSVRESFFASARNSIEVVRSRLINNIELSSNVFKTQALSKRWVDRAINRGILHGKSAAEIARDVQGLIRPDVRGGVAFAARRLGRTELNNAFHTTTVRMAASQPFVDGMQWNLSSSHPRPDPCDDYAHQDDDGLGEGVFKPNNVPDKPHPQCLCFVTIVTIDEDEFLNKLVAGKFDRWMEQAGIT